MASGFEFKAIPSFRAIDGRFVRATTEMINSFRPRMTKEAFRFKRLAKEEAPEKTGDFKKSIYFRSLPKGRGKIGFTVFADEPLATFIQKGTKEHTITPRGEGYPLKFFWEKGPKGPGIYRFMSVNHPGTKANPFMGRAFRRWLPGARAELMLMATKYQRTIAGKGAGGVVGVPGGRR